MTLSKTNFKHLVGLDHFYVGFNRAEIADLKSLTRLPFCDFNKVQSGKDFWQGVYWTAANQTYFEMIFAPDPADYQLGLAISANHIQYVDVRRIKTFYKGTQALISKVRRWEKSKRWFEYVFSKSEDTSVYIWAMHYFFCERPRKINLQASVIDRFLELEVEAPPRLLQDLKRTCFWVPFQQQRRGNRVVLEFKNKDRTPFRIVCHLNPKIQFTRFLALTAQASPHAVALPKMKHFQLTRKKNVVRLIRK